MSGTPPKGTGQSPDNSTSTAYEASHVAKAKPGTCFGLTVTNSKAASQFIQLHDSATLPADTAVPVLPIEVPAGTTVGIDFGYWGRYFFNGIVVCNSSTGPTKTIGSADCWFDVQVS